MSPGYLMERDAGLKTLKKEDCFEKAKDNVERRYELNLVTKVSSAPLSQRLLAVSALAMASKRTSSRF